MSGTLPDVVRPAGDETVDAIELWNVADGVPAMVGAHERFAVVGRLREPAAVAELSYALNGSAPRPVVVRPDAADPSLQRLSRPGDFAIDTISCGDLRDQNELVLTAVDSRDVVGTTSVRFPATTSWGRREPLSAALARARHAQEVVQVVDGRWTVAADGAGRACLRVATDDTGLDRIALLSPPVESSDYTITACLRVTRWTRSLHNVGLLFGWRGHRPGDGHALPPEWTTGLAYYYSRGAGLRLRIGEDVHYDSSGRKVGDRLLAEAPVSRWRGTLARASNRVGGGTTLRQIRPGVAYWFQARISDAGYSLAVWPDGSSRPEPQVVAPPPEPAPLPGAAGIIAHYCAVDVTEFRVEEGSP